MNNKSQNSKKIPAVIIAGPTASGKTALSVHLAKRLCGEIVSADSMQLYRGMSIASAKPDESEKSGIPHHMLDFLDPGESYSVAQYTKDAKEIIKGIHERGKTVIICGGTGLYIDSLLNNIDFGEEPDSSDLRLLLQQRLQKEGAEALHRELEKLDSEAAASLHVNNTGRVIRALELYMLSGKTMGERLERSRRFESPYAPVYMGIDFINREALYERINRRVDIMLEKGLCEEARFYMNLHGKTSRQAIGHKELFPYFKGEITFDEAVEKLKTETRRYAKRQLTWLRKNTSIKWFFRDEYQTEEEFFKTVENFTSKELESLVQE